MRDPRTVAACLLGTLLPISANAACVGESLIPQLTATAPDAVQEMFERASAVPNGKGRFWRVDREGLDASYLLGSFHAAEALDTLTAEMWSTFDQARTVVVEVDLDQQAAMEVRMSTDVDFSFDLTGPGISERLSAAQRGHVTSALRARGMRLEDVDQMRPWLLASLLSFPACHLQSMASGERPMDVVLAERALAKGLPVLGLEGYEEAIAAFRRVNPEILLASIASTGELAVQEEDLFRTNLDLYEDGQIAVIAELGILLGEQFAPELDHRAMSDIVLAEILDARNLAWVEPVRAALADGGTFVVVGALHLPGEMGLVELLRNDGFTVTRLDTAKQ